jgi:hypothetical protein
MASPLPVLDRITIATPCHASWEAMRGEGPVRFCGACRLHVYDLSGMTRAEAESLLARTEGRLCVRFFRRADGTILTQDCPEGLRAAARRRLRWALGRAAAGLALVLGSVALGGGCRPENGVLRGSRAREVPGLRQILDWIDPPPVIQGKIAMGAPLPPVAPPPPPEGETMGDVTR